MREGEVQGEKYNFISRDEFLKMIENDELLEYNEYCGNFYGTPIKPVNDCIENGQEILLEVDVNGAYNVRKKCKDCFSIFIMPPSFEALKTRLQGRGTETEDIIEKRLTAAKEEISRANEYDYIVVNDVLLEAVEDIATIIKAERMKSNRAKYAL